MVVEVTLVIYLDPVNTNNIQNYAMRRADRLFQLLTLLRNRRTAITAAHLAEVLEVSERTVYRDVQSLMLTGVPIEGEAGVGYRLNRHFDLPPLMFSSDEIEALLLGTKMVQAWSDKQLAASASQAMQKILAVLPQNLRHLDEQLAFLVPDCHVDKELVAFSEEIRLATRSQLSLNIQYRRADGEYSSRVIQPLGLVYWGKVWTLVAWCEMRNEYRAFRLDRIQALQTTEQLFELTPEKNLKHYLEMEKQTHEQQYTESL